MVNPEQKSLLGMPLDIADKIFDAAGYDARVKLRSTCGSIRDFCFTKDREISLLCVHWTTHEFRVDCFYKNGTVIRKSAIYENGSRVAARILCDILSHPNLVIDKLELVTQGLFWRLRGNLERFFSETRAAIAEMFRSLNRLFKVKELSVNSSRESTGVDFTLFLRALDETVLMSITHFKNDPTNDRFDTREITGSAQWRNAHTIMFWSRSLDNIRDYWDVPVLSLRIDTISKETVEQLLDHYARTETFSKVSFFCSTRFQLTAASFPDLTRDEADQNTLFYHCAETNVTLTIRFMYKSFGIQRLLPTGT